MMVLFVINLIAKVNELFSDGFLCIYIFLSFNSSISVSMWLANLLMRFVSFHFDSCSICKSANIWNFQLLINRLATSKLITRFVVDSDKKQKITNQCMLFNLLNCVFVCTCKPLPKQQKWAHRVLFCIHVKPIGIDGQELYQSKIYRIE